MIQQFYCDYEVKWRAQKARANAERARLLSESRSDPTQRKPDPVRLPKLGAWNLRRLVGYLGNAAS